MIEALDIEVHGVVQGVGFRPFVYRAAKHHLICGWVLNATAGVFIHAEGEERDLDDFVIELSENAPAAACITEIDLKEAPLEGFDTFTIRYSDEGEATKTTLVSPDLATCDDCVRELFDPDDRRFHYPFINCTNCGPRFTIIDKLPYDRAHTSMAAFPMCPACADEYGNPEDRRFHAQPDACFECGPHISWFEPMHGEDESEPAHVTWGTDRQASDAIIERAAELLRQGGIVAIKGLGGFHLACDAENPEALTKLRSRKRREGKAFAVMAPSIEALEERCLVSDAERKLLTGAQHPIVLLRKRPEARFAAGLADGLPELGAMLPYTPLQHLIMAAFGGLLVMTSGNLHDEPIQTDDAEAFRALHEVADAFVGNNRPIRTRFDDSVARVIRIGGEEAGGATLAAAKTGADAPANAADTPAATAATSAATSAPIDAVQMIRRARGFAPMPVAVKACAAPDGAPILAVGPEQKNTLCLLRCDEAFVSQHIGDMENAETFDAWLQVKGKFQQLFDIEPAHIVRDLHPEYLSSKWAEETVRGTRDEASPNGSPADAPRTAPALHAVQHHHAHIAAVMAENELTDAVIGFAFDGTGYGADGAIWGGEVLLANLQDFERMANFAYVPMPGGAAAIKRPLRMAYGALDAFDLLEHPAAVRALAALGDEASVCETMIERGINCPPTSSVGRLFDAASAILGVCTQPAYEGEAAILLEAALYGDDTAGKTTGEGGVPGPEGATWIDGESAADTAARYAIAITKNVATESSTAHDTSVLLLDAAPTFAALLDDMEAGVPVTVIARRFHDAFVQAIVQMAQLTNALYGISTVALGGGVFMNRYLTEHALSALQSAGFTVALSRELPPNDGAVSYGQAAVCAARLAAGIDDAADAGSRTEAAADAAQTPNPADNA